MLKRIAAGMLAVILIMCFSVGAVCLDQADVSAVSAVLYCPLYDEVLFEKNSGRSLSMASTTKIMTALIALEEYTPFREVLITEEMVSVEGTSSGLRAGDSVKLNDLVKCMLLESGNDAANAVALSLAGSFGAFAELMNARAGQIGMLGTNFVTPSGLDAENHYTTAYDMALLTAEAMRNEEFQSICSMKSDTVIFSGQDKAVTLYNHNRLLDTYIGCIGVKTGFTKKSGRCLVSAAERNGITLIAVTLNAGDDWNDHKKMLDYGFSQFSEQTADTDFSMYSVRVAGGASDFCIPVSEGFICGIYGDKQITRRVYLEKFLYAPVKKGDVIGSAVYYCGNRIVKKLPLLASCDVPIAEEEKVQNITDRLSGLLDSWWKNG